MIARHASTKTAPKYHLVPLLPRLTCDDTWRLHRVPIVLLRPPSPPRLPAGLSLQPLRSGVLSCLPSVAWPCSHTASKPLAPPAADRSPRSGAPFSSPQHHAPVSGPSKCSSALGWVRPFCSGAMYLACCLVPPALFLLLSRATVSPVSRLLIRSTAWYPYSRRSLAVSLAVVPPLVAAVFSLRTDSPVVAPPSLSADPLR